MRTDGDDLRARIAQQTKDTRSRHFRSVDNTTPNMLASTQRASGFVNYVPNCPDTKQRCQNCIVQQV